jgi:uncharacterized protein (TIGR01244 family)
MRLIGNAHKIALATAWGVAMAWAASIPAAPGVPNFHQVNEWIFRGGQPSPAGFQSLAKLGVRTVIDLRASSEQSDWEQKQVLSAGMRYVHVPLHGRETPTQADIDKAFAVMDDKSQWPVFVHCREGKDRTGMIIACYRMSHDGWSNERAHQEALSCASRSLTGAMDRYILQFRPGPGGEAEKKN